MTDMQALFEQIEKLEGDEIAIVEKLVERIQQGHAVYGPWTVADDVRSYPARGVGGGGGCFALLCGGIGAV